MCRNCMRKSHNLVPFHRIQFWKKTHYVDDWLCNLGLTINLGHRGECCPRQPSTLESGPYKPPTSKIRALKHYVDPYESPSGLCDTPAAAKRYTILHTNGVHQVWVRRCECCKGEGVTPEVKTCTCCEDKDVMHLLRQALFPSTFKSPQTAFTFSLLDDFRKANLECKTTAYAYFHKLRRVNSEFFPESCPVCITDMTCIFPITHYMIGPVS